MSLTAATTDTGIKAVATASMYDMSRSISRGYKDSYTRAQRQQVMEYLSQQRWTDAEKGSYAGENAHSRYYSEDVFKVAAEPKELFIVPDADHVDRDKFFSKNVK